MAGIYSDYYNREFSEHELRNALYFYFEWCEDNYLKPEIETIDEINSSNINHILYHAVLKGMRV